MIKDFSSEKGAQVFVNVMDIGLLLNILVKFPILASILEHCWQTMAYKFTIEFMRTYFIRLKHSNIICSMVHGTFRLKVAVNWMNLSDIYRRKFDWIKRSFNFVESVF